MGLIRYLGVAGELGEGTTLGAHPAEGQVFGIGQGQSLFIGRGQGSQIVIESNRVARAHVTLALMPGTGDRLVVTDLDSTNQTSIAGEVKTSGVLSPGQELVIAGLFRFRFEDADAPDMRAAVPRVATGARMPIGVVLLVVGLALGGFSACTRTWFTDQEGKADIGLHDYRVCTESGCETKNLGTLYDSKRGEFDERSSVFQSVIWMVTAFYWFAAATGLWGLIQLVRRRRATALWIMLPMMVVSLIGAQILFGMLPVLMDGADPARLRAGAYLHGIGGLLAIAAVFLLLPRQQPGNDPAAADVPGA